jgi:hypothetical protein
VRYELGFYIPEDDFFIVTAVRTSNLRYIIWVSLSREQYFGQARKVCLNRDCKCSRKGLLMKMFDTFRKYLEITGDGTHDIHDPPPPPFKSIHENTRSRGLQVLKRNMR